MRVFRLTRPDYAPGLDGIGAMRAGGRWNSPGLPAVYCASSISLAALEVFVHLPPNMRTPEKLPRLVVVTLEIPDDAEVELAAPGPLPGNLSIEDYRAIGDDWIVRGETLALSVPSLVIPYEQNVILNPEHGQIGSVDVIGVEEFRFDPRMGAASP